MIEINNKNHDLNQWRKFSVIIYNCSCGSLFCQFY